MRRTLPGGERTLSELAAPFAMSFSAASKHIRVLEGIGLVWRRIQCRTHICRLEATSLAAAGEWVRFYEQFWNTRFDALATDSDDVKKTEGGAT